VISVCARSLARGIILGAYGLVFGLAGQAAQPDEFFELRVRPVLAKNCYACHTQSQLGGLRLDSRQAMLKGGTRGVAVVPGDSAGSLLMRAVRHDHADLKMPPQGKLSEQEVSDLAAWIEAGAVWPKTHASANPGPKGFRITAGQRAFWSFQPIGDPEPPAVKAERWVRGAIDRFILAKLEAQGLKPNEAADKRTLIRRATFDVTGLPPTPEEVEAFRADDSAEAFARVVDRLLASPHYGERWGRYWLDIARYSDDVLIGDAPQFYHYRDWVIEALNADMPYDLFVKAQLAADLLPGVDKEKFLPALTVFMDAPSEFTDDDRVDVATRGFLGLTAACAKCHDHKYDPIPTEDYYSLLGVFRATQYREAPLAPADVVENYKLRRREYEEAREELKRFLVTESYQLGDILAARTADYLVAAWRVLGAPQATPGKAADTKGIDRATLERWIEYLRRPGKQHPFLREWERLMASRAGESEIRKESERFEALLLDVIREKKEVDEFNKIISYGYSTGRMLGEVEGRTMQRPKYILWQDLLAEGDPRGSFNRQIPNVDGVFYYQGEKLERFLPERWLSFIAKKRDEVERLERAVPPPYPYLSIIEDVAKPENLQVHIRGNPQNLGAEAPRRFLQILSRETPAPFTDGSGRRQLAEAIATPENPLTARVIVNRIWQYHFGQGIVRTPSNFGQTGDRPSHPELLDYLARRLIKNDWSLKSLHREIMLSAAYRLSPGVQPRNQAADPDNRLLWRHARRRLDVEALRDSLLFVAGELDRTRGGPPISLDEPGHKRRTIYSEVSRRKLDTMLATFDFPNPNTTSARRIETTVPLQKLFLLNSELMLRQSKALAARIEREANGNAAAKVGRAYKLIFQRPPTDKERRTALEFTNGDEHSWARYAHVLLSSNEFLHVE
jgi:hypothetical protein